MTKRTVILFQLQRSIDRGGFLLDVWDHVTIAPGTHARFNEDRVAFLANS